MKPPVNASPIVRALLMVAVGILCAAGPAAARPISTVQLSVTMPEDKTCPCNCSTGRCTFASVLDSVSITAPSSRSRCIVSLLSGPTHAFPNTFGLNDVNAHPNTTLSAGQWTYRPDVDFNDCGRTVPERFTFRVTDPMSGESTGVCTMTINVQSVNDLPVANNILATTRFNAPVAITLTASDRDNADTCSTNDSLTFSRVSGPSHGTLSAFVGNGAIRTYTPNGTFAGDDSFTYVCSDGHVSSAPKTVTIRVLPGISVANVSANEGSRMLVTFTLFPRYAAGGRTATVEWHTTDGTAQGQTFPPVPGIDDYLRASSIPGFPVSFAPTVGTQTGIITTVPDFCLENNETFNVILTNPTNAFLLDGTAVFTIRNEDTTCRDPIFGTLLDSCLCNGFLLGTVEGTPTDATATIGAPLEYGVLWTVPDPMVWRSLKTMDVRLSDEYGDLLTVRWNEASNTFGLLDPTTGQVVQSGLPGRPGRLVSSAATVELRPSQVIGSGPSGRSVLLDLIFIFNRQAEGRTFNVDVSSTDDSDHEQGYSRAGTITVLPWTGGR